MFKRKKESIPLPLCMNCKWLVRSYTASSKSNFCGKTKKEKVNVVTGEVSTSYATCEFERSAMPWVGCSKKGKYYEPKDTINTTPQTARNAPHTP